MNALFILNDNWLSVMYTSGVKCENHYGYKRKQMHESLCMFLMTA